MRNHFWNTAAEALQRILTCHLLGKNTEHLIGQFESAAMQAEATGEIPNNANELAAKKEWQEWQLNKQKTHGTDT